jgi:hypothetical protein
MAGPALVVRIVGDTKELSSALKEADSGMQLFGKSVSVGGVAAMAGLAGAAVVAGKALVDMTVSAAEDRDEQAKLALAIAQATGSTQDYSAATDAAIAAGQELAFTDSETRAALEPLVRSTGDMTKATEQMSIAQDIARLSGVDLATAADAVAKANRGQDKSLKSLIPGLKLGETSTESLANAQKLAAGQAKLYGNSTAGASAKMADGMAELGETIGEALLPLLDALLPALTPIMAAFGKLIKALLPVLTPLIKLLAEALKLVLNILLKVVDAVVAFIGKIGKAIDRVRELLRKIPGLSSIPGIGSLSAGATGFVGSSGASTRATGSSVGGFGAGVVINITGDPLTIERTVVRALRTYSRRNGGLAGLT